MIGCDLTLELKAIPDLREAIAYCESVRDYQSRELLEEILESEESHVDWLETQLSLIDKITLEKQNGQLAFRRATGSQTPHARQRDD
jgi:bacterioferritin